MNTELSKVPPCSEYRTIKGNPSALNTELSKVPLCSEYRTIKGTPLFRIQNYQRYPSALNTELSKVPLCSEYRTIKGTPLFRIQNYQMYPSAVHTELSKVHFCCENIMNTSYNKLSMVSDVNTKRYKWRVADMTDCICRRKHDSLQVEPIVNMTQYS